MLVCPPYADTVNRVFAAFATGDFTAMREFIAQYGKMAAAFSFFLMIFQSIAAPLPAFLITSTPTSSAGGRELFFPGAALWLERQFVSTSRGFRRVRAAMS
jgi:hypothetical protein